tara:strand:- start:935 stop:1555 length:621 start_codon:yes stop_codon:yes gene_type:complete
VDPSGEFAVLFYPAAGALAGGGVNLAYQLYIYDGNWSCVNWWDVTEWAIIGASLVPTRGTSLLGVGLRGASRGNKSPHALRNGAQGGNSPNPPRPPRGSKAENGGNGSNGNSADSADSSNGSSKEVLTRKSPGGDGGRSEQIIERDSSGNVISRTHRVYKDGKIIHQHQNHVGKHGGIRQLPDEWTGTKTINAPYENYPPQFGPGQ